MSQPTLTISTPLLLGSKSPRRSELLTALGIPYTIWVAPVDETIAVNEAPHAYLERIVAAKQAAVVQTAPEEQLRSCGAVLVADTIVYDGATILGKPKSANEAAQMLERLSGRAHDVLTRFAVSVPSAHRSAVYAETVTTRVVFRALEHTEIEAYVQCGEGFDKAGGYAAQGRASAFVAEVHGSYTNVVGLPTCAVILALRHAGLIP